MDIEKLIEDLRGLLEQYGEKIPYGELVGAPWPYSRAGDLVWQDPEPYFIEQAATTLSTLQAENEKLRGYINDLETQHRTEMCENGYDCVELGKLRAELEQVKAERDAAISDLETIMAYGGGNLDTCQYCKNGQCYARGGTKLCLPQWRGPKED